MSNQQRELTRHLTRHFEIIGNGFQGNNKKMKVAEELLIREIKPTLNIQHQSVPLQLFS